MSGRKVAHQMLMHPTTACCVYAKFFEQIQTVLWIKVCLVRQMRVAMWVTGLSVWKKFENWQKCKYHQSPTFKLLCASKGRKKLLYSRAFVHTTKAQEQWKKDLYIDHYSSLKILPKSSHQKLPGVPSSHQAGFQGLAGVKHMFCAKLQSFRLFGLCILVASMHSILLPPASPQTCRSWLHKMPCLKSFRVLRSILQVI